MDALPARRNMNQLRERPLRQSKALLEGAHDQRRIMARVSGMRSRRWCPCRCANPLRPCASSRHWCGPRPCPRRVRSRCDSGSGGEAGQEDQLQQFALAQQGRALLGNDPALDGLGAHLFNAMPAPSSDTSMMTWLPSWLARSFSVPSASLPPQHALRAAQCRGRASCALHG